MAPRLDFKSYNPTILVIFGATGDLASRKLVPALFRLYQKKLLPPLFQVIGFSRQNLTDSEFQSRIKEIIEKEKSGSGETRESFIKLFSYSQGFFEKKSGYSALAKQLGFQDNQWRTCANKLFYLAVPPIYYKKILHNLADSGLTIPCSSEEGWTRVLVEKPFGRDLKTAEELDGLLGKLFKEEQIYRIDHYLGKETVQNILVFRFSNSFLEPAWNKDSIERIDIRFWETGGVEGRGEFYDGVGALRDVGQNHLLQLLALFTMDNPGSFDADNIRRNRAEVLRSLRIFSKKDAAELTSRAQYDGYRKEEGVAKDSNTETFFRLTAFLDTPAWQGVPINLEAGKMLPEAKVEVAITFRHAAPCLCPPGRHYQNILRYRIQPKEGIYTSFCVKRPGAEMTVEEKDFSFDYKQVYAAEEFIDAYERLLIDAIAGNQTLFVSTDEIKASWRFIDPIAAKWKKNVVPLGFYKQGTLPDLPLAGERLSLKKESAHLEAGFVGLGKMGKNMALRLLDKGWHIAVFDKAVRGLTQTPEKITIAVSIKDLVEKLKRPRIVWLMLPAGKAVDEVIFGGSRTSRNHPDSMSLIRSNGRIRDGNGLFSYLEKGDIIIDGGNSFYEDSIRRARRLKKLGINFLDVGVSGGPGGARNGACIMVGGDKSVYETLEPLFRDLAAPDAYQYVGKAGAGHFVKMVHNGIEYGMMQSLAEGFNLLRSAELRGLNPSTSLRAGADKRGKLGYRFNLAKIADLYNHGSVIESRLMGWLKKAFEEYGEGLKDVSGSVAHTGEAEWTIKTAKKLAVPVKIIEESFQFRVQSAKKPSYIGKILSALRNQFGGHGVK